MNISTRIALWRYDHSRAKLTERLATWLAWRMPRKLAYWASIRVMAHATLGEYGTQEVPALLAVDALKRWER